MIRLAPILAALYATALAQSVQLHPASGSFPVSFETGPQQEVGFSSVGGGALDIVVAPGPGLALTLVLPDGSELQEDNAAAHGAVFARETLPANQSLLLEGEVQLIHLEAPESGTYRLLLDASALALPPDTVLVRVFTTGAAGRPLRTGLSALGERPEIEVGDPVALALLVFEGDLAVVGASAHGTVYDGDGTVLAPLAFRDDGVDPDAAAGDGLYSARFSAAQMGLHFVSVAIEGVAGGVPFEALEKTQFTVFEPNLHLTGGFDDHGTDLDGDGFLDVLEVTFESRGPVRAGSYRLRVLLAADNGASVESNDLLALADGATLTATFGAERLRALGVDGPFRVERAILGFERRFLDRLDDLGVTGAYRLDAWERPPTLLLPLVREEVHDDDGDGSLDRLVLTIEVDTLAAGDYHVSGSLLSPAGVSVATAAATPTLSAGRQELALSFSGLDIGATREDGPYRLVAVSVYPDFRGGGSALAASLGTTAAYPCARFVGCAVAYDFDDLLAYLAGLDIDAGLRTSLLRKAENAHAAFERGSVGAAASILGALIAEVEAQRARGVPDPEASALVDIAGFIRDRLD